MPKTETWDASRRIKVLGLGLMGELSGPITSAPTTSTSSSEGRNDRKFECPLCVDIFTSFSQLKWHLQSMHPRRDMIMKLVMERYGISEKDEERPESVSTTKDSQCAQEHSKCCTETAEKFEAVSSSSTGATNRVSHLPLKLRHKYKNRCEERRKECKDNRMECSNGGPSDDSSSWDSYLSFCLSNCVSLETARGGQ